MAESRWMETAETMQVGDRRVHAEWAQMQVVRYDRAGKWYLEPCGEYAHLPRQNVTLDGAAEYAAMAVRQFGGVVRFGVPGGKSFDRRARHYFQESA